MLVTISSAKHGNDVSVPSVVYLRPSNVVHANKRVPVYPRCEQSGASAPARPRPAHGSPCGDAPAAHEIADDVVHHERHLARHDARHLVLLGEHLERVYGGVLLCRVRELGACERRAVMVAAPVFTLLLLVAIARLAVAPTPTGALATLLPLGPPSGEPGAPHNVPRAPAGCLAAGLHDHHNLERRRDEHRKADRVQR